MHKQRKKADSRYCVAIGCQGAVLRVQFIRKWLAGPIIVAAGIFGSSALACTVAVNSPLEKLYCDVVAQGEGAGLPSFDDFRRNPPATQRLLLKRPAQRAGLNLPATAKAVAPKPKSSAKAAATKRPAAKAPASSVAKPSVPSNLKGCTISAGAIQCGNAHYRLLDNRGNRSLSPQALAASNTLVFSAVPNYSSNLELHNYLQQAYSLYLTKMHTIGLAGTTLSYSKFYYIFDETQQQQQDFVRRFGVMYDYLKKDKSAMAVAKQHRGKKAPPLSACQAIGDNFITCDARGSNWVYAR